MARLRALLAAGALACLPVAHAATAEEEQAGIARYDGIFTGVSLFANGDHLRTFCDRYPKEGAALRAAVAEFEAAYPDLVMHAREEPWFRVIGDSVASSLELTDDPDDFLHNAQRCADSAETIHKLASDPEARALFLAWRFPQPAGTPSAGAP